MGYNSLTIDQLDTLAKELDSCLSTNGDIYYPNLNILKIKKIYKNLPLPIKEIESLEDIRNVKELLSAFSIIHRLGSFLYEIKSEDLPLYINDNPRSVQTVVVMWRLKNGF